MTETIARLLLTYRAAADMAERPLSTVQDHTNWRTAQTAYYAAGGRDPAGGWAAYSFLCAAVAYFGETATINVIAAKARCYAWRPFAKHSDYERANHKTDIETCDDAESKAMGFDLPGADPMGDE